MEQYRVTPKDFRLVVQAYHGLPVVIALALVGIFLVGFYFTGRVVLSSVVAAVPSAFLMWRWILAGRQIDRWGCPKCGKALPKKMYWSYPPKVCPHCGERLDR
jgi:hypothetical protein